MAMVKGGKAAGGFDVDRLLNFEKRSGIKDGDIESFITKVDAVNVAIQAMKDGELDPADVHVDGVPTIEEERQMEAEKRRRRVDLARREQEERARKKREEHEKWWRGAELLYGERKRLSGIGALENSIDLTEAKRREGGGLSESSTRSLTEEERMRLKDRYSMEYGRWDTWTPTDPATMAEIEGKEEEEDAKRSKEFETNNPDFCTQMIDDMKTRSEASDKKDSEATAARLKGNRFYRVKRWEKALELYMTSLKARPYTVNTLANVAQTLIKLERWSDALDFCDRALHVDGACVKALSRRASTFVQLAEHCSAASSDATAVSVATATTTATTTATAAAATRVSSPGSIGIAAGEMEDKASGVSTAMSSAISDKSKEAVGVTGGGRDNNSDDGGGGGEGGGGGGGGYQALYDRFGGREGLLALALVDLETAVETDPESEDVRRQRDALQTEIDEAKVEAEVMKKARSAPRTVPPIVPATADSSQEEGGAKACPVDGNKNKENGPNGGRQLSAPLDRLINDALNIALLPENGAASLDMGARVGTAATRNGDGHSEQTVTGGDDFATVDRALEEALGGGVPDSEAGEAFQLRALLHLANVLEASGSARVYFRASGGLARFAGATRAAVSVSTAAVADHRAGCYSDHPPSENDSSATPSTATTAATATAAIAATTTTTTPATAAAATNTNTSTNTNTNANTASNELTSSLGSSAASGGGIIPETAPVEKEGTVGDGALDEHTKKRQLTTAEVESLTRRLELMLRALAAALLGGERLAQQDVLRSGLLDGPCAQALLMVSDGGAQDKSTATIGRTVGVAGAAATVLSRVVDDPDIGAHVSRSGPVLFGVVGLIAAGSATPLDVEAAAAVLSTVLFGRTASAAAKTLQDKTEVKTARAGIGSPAMIVASALLAWREGSGLMQGAPASTGSSLCGVLANLAMHQDFRGSFAEISSPETAGGRGNEQISPVKVLVLVAGDTKARCSEARPLALAALVNACLQEESAQAATLSAGGLALALAVLSLDGEERSRHAPPLVSARSAGLLARLSMLPAALEVMVRPGVIDRIIKATVRSAAVGSNLHTTGTPLEKSDLATEAAAGTAHAMEREHLVRALASILRKNATTNPAGRPTDTVPSPSSTVDTAKALEGRGGIASTAVKLGLAEALVSFLPAAREEGLQGVTRESVALRPTWSAPPALTANVGGCLLHLMDGECSGNITDQVVAAGGIPRLVSLFANSGAEGGAKSARTNAAICLAKLAREPRHKEAIASLRGMEMLVQAGAGLAR